MSGENSGENTPRTLSGAPASSSSWARPSDRPRVGRVGDWNNDNSNNASRSGSGSRFATLGSLGGGGGSSRAPPPPSRSPQGDDEDGEGEGEGEGENLYAGGERSGLSVQTPGRGAGGSGGSGGVTGGAADLVKNLLRQAAAGGTAPAPQAEQRPRAFFGGGHTLGSEDQESSYVPDPEAEDDEEEEVAIRHIILWRNGFQIGEDGELRTYDDPQNAQLLEQINNGTAPLSVLGVGLGQRVELRVAKRTREEYTPPPGPRAFVGAGQRLGAPVPTFTGTSEGGSGSVPGAFPAAAGGGSVERESVTTRFEVDQTQPTTSIQIRLVDGSRMSARMNLTHTVGDIRNYINASHPQYRTLAYTIVTTFPNRVLDNNEQTIEAAKLQNSVVHQRLA